MRKIKRWEKTDNLKSKPHPQLLCYKPICQGPLPSFSIETALWLMATKSLVSATATLGIERRGGGQGREDPGIPGCHPRSRPRVPRLLPPPLAAASARETRRSGAEERGEEQGDPRPAATTLAHPLRRPQRLQHTRQPGGAREAPYGQETFPPSLDAPFPLDLEVSGNRGRSRHPSPPRHPRRPPLPSRLRGLTRGAAGAPHAPRATRSCWQHGGATRPEEKEQDGGREGRGGAAKGPSSSARRLRASPRTAEQLCSRLRLLRSAPPLPAARRSLHCPARRPPSFVATTSARRGARAGALQLSARVSGSAVRPRLRALMDMVRGMQRVCRRVRGAHGSSRALGIATARFLHTRRRKGRKDTRPRIQPHILSRRPRVRGRDRHSHCRVTESPGRSLHSSGSLSGLTAVTISPDDTERS